MSQDRPCQEAAPFPAGVATKAMSARHWQKRGVVGREGWEAGRARPVVGRLGREGQSPGRPGQQL